MIATASPAPAVTFTPNASAPRASAGRSVPRYSSHERTIKVSWPHAAITARNDIALKMTASVPKACGCMLRAASANIANPRIEPVNLIASAAALPLSTSLLGMKLAMVRAVVKGHHYVCTAARPRPHIDIRFISSRGKAKTPILVYATPQNRDARQPV